MTAYLSMAGICKNFDSVAAVDNVSMEVEKGEFVSLLGPSGSGKSTLLYMIAGLQKVSRGHLSLRGKSLLETPPNKRNIGMVFQRYTLIPHMNVAENIAFPLKVRRWTQARIDARVEAMLSLAQLKGFASRKPSQLSGGQQQRVALTRALSYDPEILLMDEPLSALDKKLKEDLQIEIRRIHQAMGTTILYVTHDQEEALRLSDRIAVFNCGRVDQIATGKTLYDDPASKFVASFVGNSNFLPVDIVDADGGNVMAQLPSGTRLSGRATSRPEIGATGELLIRPEQFAILPGDSADDGKVISAAVLEATYLGEIMQIRASTSWGQVVTIRCKAADFIAGVRDDRCRLGFSPSERPPLFFPTGAGAPA